MKAGEIRKPSIFEPIADAEVLYSLPRTWAWVRVGDIFNYDANLAELLDVQNDRCALRGLPFQYHGLGGDKALLPSLDRINGAGHYEAGDLEVVCQFVNFWKSDSDNEDFKRLLMLVRGVETE